MKSMSATQPSPTPIPASHLPMLDDRPNAYLATITPSGALAVNPLAVLWDGAYLRVSTLKSRQKYKNLLADDRVALCVVDRHNPNRYVEVRGHAELSDDLDRSVINRIAKQYMDADVYPFDKPGDERVTITVIPDKVLAPRIPLVTSLDRQAGTGTS
jgi:PPOX class probable F420-dependent enzyme